MASLVGAAGCTKKQSAPLHQSQVKVQNTVQGTGNLVKDRKAVAAHLEMLARGVAGVRNANCVVFGKYAIVGIDVDEKLERSRVGTIKYSVAEAFRKDPYGIDALVTADMDLAQRLREIRADVRQGRPVAGFSEELADIVGRLVPQIPRNIVPPEKPENTGVNNRLQPAK
ncbi:YhcN/YlaJ family sporulation lipoprotein [Cohnella faecalis]|uniref:YhcN/YlaJ family sporulation lipoprotein n=2 Tax=Cohnella faecalis TaxID=2315694 RepID=A0A398CZ19_9BACL|nr:YhcN/YlaJ family sporulation lipoprotein [Cohnella faecalis]